MPSSSRKLLDKSCAYTEWRTPPHILDAVRKLGGGQIAFDPATSSDNPTGARFYEDRYGLIAAWTPRAEGGLIFVNPPYGRELRNWVDKIHVEAEEGAFIVALLPGQRFEQRYWQESLLIDELSAICFIRGRVAFLNKEGVPQKSNPYGFMLYVFNGDEDSTDSALSPLGRVLIPKTIYSTLTEHTHDL